MQNFASGDLQHQRQQNERRKNHEREDEVTSNKNLHDSFNDDEEGHDRHEQAQFDKNTKYRHDLKQQCDDNVHSKQRDHAEAMVQRQTRQDIGDIMADQDQRFVEYQNEQSEQLRKDIITFKQDCADYKDMQRELINIEESRIDEQRYETSDRSDAVTAERERKTRVRDDHDERVATQMMADEGERHDREHDLDMKHEREYLEKNLQEDIRRKDKCDEDKRDLRDSLLLQIEDNKRYVREEKARDLVFSDEANALMAAEDEVQKERARKKKEVDDQYYEDLRQQIEDNAVRRKREKELDRQ